MLLSDRLGLDYGKLFRNEDGGYDIDTLKTALERVKKDRENGLVWMGEPNEQKFKKFLQKRADQRAQKEEGTEEKEADAE